ncbi:cornifelin homolog B-like [Channa argus]|uniref:cornifelin homolog B-like n=1 Tax=Channa argus TaxID=215402 RepID=UPI00351FABC6
MYSGTDWGNKSSSVSCPVPADVCAEFPHHSNTVPSLDAIMSSTMVVRQPQPTMVAQNSQEWGSDICDCCDDVPECCFAFWCLPCFTCVTAKKHGECLCLPLLDYIFIGGCIPTITMSMRVSMRQRYGIRGSMCNDCVCSTFCTGCVWCQMSREMKRRNIQIVMVGAKYR